MAGSVKEVNLSITFLCRGCAGDVIFSLACVRDVAERFNVKPAYYLKLNTPLEGYNGHPCGSVCLTEEYAFSLITLLRTQEWLGEVKIWEGEHIDIDLDEIQVAGYDLWTGNLPSQYFRRFRCHRDLSKPWLDMEKKPKIPIVVSRSLRFRNASIRYDHLTRYSGVVFVGLESEWNEMQQVLPDAQYVPTETILDLAKVIARAEVFVGNQSLPFAIAEAIKVPRVLEVCPFASNVHPIGADGYDAWDMRRFETALEDALEGRECLAKD